MIRLSPEAEADLRDSVSKITRDNGKPVALRIYRRIRAALLPLDRFPHLARAGRIAGTRELVIRGLPFIAVYQIETDGILVVSIIHGAMQWPPGDEANSSLVTIVLKVCRPDDLTPLPPTAEYK